MDSDGVIALCTDLPEAVEDYPFGDDLAGFKICGKLFALILLSGEPGSVNLKCDPVWALELRAQHRAVRPGYHANKRHWNTVDLDDTIPDDDVHDMVIHSYEMVIKGLPRDDRRRLLGQ